MFEEITSILFERVHPGQIICVYSDLTESEISKVPQRVQDFFNNIEKDNKEIVKVTPEALLLAQTYIKENVVGKTSIDDCIHIATATINKVDILVSWNF